VQGLIRPTPYTYIHTYIQAQPAPCWLLAWPWTLREEMAQSSETSPTSSWLRSIISQKMIPFLVTSVRVTAVVVRGPQALGQDDYSLRPSIRRIIMKKKNVIFLGVSPCRSCVDERFGGTYRLHLQGKYPRARNQREQVAECNLQPPALAGPRSRICLLLRWRRYVLRNVGSHKIYRAPHPRRRHSS
jgi:hypothetical protein